ncbi:hypothetical protein C8Q78DRAFT_990555 [Trametes maxima]|nr:hypothetical protein C8Q78DRAFT_990555 [Trametes maxima]
MRAYVEDVTSLVRKQLWSEIGPALEAKDGVDYEEALRRRNAYYAWRKADHPLDWGDHSLNCTTITKMVSTTQAEAAARGLPQSAKGQWSVEDFVSHLYRIGVTLGFNALRPPVWNKGTFWPILRAAVTEALRRARLSHQDNAAAEREVKHAFAFVIAELRIHLIPDATPPPPNSRRPSLEPSIHAWTVIGARPRHVVTGHAAPPTQMEDVDFQISQRSVDSMLGDSSCDWDTTQVVIGDYHRYLARSVLPSNWRNAPGKCAETDVLTSSSYAWAEEQFNHKLEDWRVDLALHLAFLISKVAPRVAWPSKGADLVAHQLTSKGIGDGRKPVRDVPPNKFHAAIQSVRSLAWTERNAKGAQAESIYFSQASVVFLSWMHAQSPLRLHMNKANATLGQAWTNKHGNKSLSPVNLVRMGIAYPKSSGIVGRPIYGSNFDILPEPQLHEWHRHVVKLIKSPPHGPYLLVEEIFGVHVMNMLRDRGHFPGTAAAPPAPMTTPVTQPAATSTKHPLDEEDDDVAHSVAEREVIRTRYY